MRDNSSVTQRSHDVQPNTILSSRTDAQGVITFVNQSFVAISGFTREQLLGRGRTGYVIRSQHPRLDRYQNWCRGGWRGPRRRLGR